VSVPETISLKELQEAAKNSPLRKGMIVRCLPMGAGWAGFEGCEFYVLEDEAEPMWGHAMAIRHYLDVDPDTARMLGRAEDKDGKHLFSFTSLPADCVEILSQDTMTSLEEQPFIALEAWKEAWADMLREDAKWYEHWKARYEETGSEEHKRWMKTFSQRGPWTKENETHMSVFSPDMIKCWVPEKDE
jgi:hypothetical protein